MVDDLAPVAVAEMLRRPAAAGVFLLDVREPDEREAARIEPSVHIPLQEVPDRLDELPRDRPIVVYCHHGHRSAMVAAFLEHSGFTSVANLTGGIDSWSMTVDPNVPRYR